MAKESMAQKAERLLTEGRVTLVEAPGTYAVRGDTRSYLTTALGVPAKALAGTLGVPPGSCTCEAYGACSHLLAAMALRRVADGTPS